MTTRTGDTTFVDLLLGNETLAAAASAQTVELQAPLPSPKNMLSIHAVSGGEVWATAGALFAQTGPEDLQAYARWWLTNRASNDWRGYDVGRLDRMPSITNFPSGLIRCSRCWRRSSHDFA